MSEIESFQFASVARQAARAAAETIAQHTPDNTQVELKADASPVTIADRNAEEILRQQLLVSFPEHAIWGEEFGRDQTNGADYLWLLDPIDGTKSWISGLPFWSIQIALQQTGQQKIIVGVSHAPGFNELAWAARGHGAWLNGQRLSTSPVTALADCRLSSGNLGSLSKNTNAWAAYGEVVAQCNRTRGYGDFYHYHRLAAGQLDAVIESDVNILDIAALTVIVEEAGGVFTDLQGQPISLETTSVLAAANPALHQTLLTQLDTDA